MEKTTKTTAQSTRIMAVLAALASSGCALVSVAYYIIAAINHGHDPILYTIAVALLSLAYGIGYYVYTGITSSIR